MSASRIDLQEVIDAYNAAYQAANGRPLRESDQRIVYEAGWFQLRSTVSSSIMARYRRKQIEAMTDELRRRVSASSPTKVLP